MDTEYFEFIKSMDSNNLLNGIVELQWKILKGYYDNSIEVDGDTIYFKDTFGDKARPVEVYRDTLLKCWKYRLSQLK